MAKSLKKIKRHENNTNSIKLDYACIWLQCLQLQALAAYKELL